MNLNDTAISTMLKPGQLKENYEQVLDRVEAAAQKSGRRASDVAVIAVTKYADPEDIRTLIELGHADFGENRVQQMTQRIPQINEFVARKRTLAAAASESKLNDRTPETIRWHMIGNLQRNKAKACLPLVNLVHSVDSLKLAEEIDAIAAKLELRMDVLLQVNVSGEQSKSGVASPAVSHLAEQMEEMMNIRLRGLMTMAPIVENPEETRPVFRRLRELFDDVDREGVAGKAFNILSMGMTDDYEVAIEEGANVVRVGRAIFGERTAD